MDITLTLPDHVSAAFPDPETAAGWLQTAAADYARAQAVSAARDEAQNVLAAAAAAFDGDGFPEIPTPAERVARLEADQAALREQVRDVGITLATAAGVPAEDAVALIEQTLAQ